MGHRSESLSGVRVVIVGKDRECLQVAGLSLEVEGARVRCATTPEQGLDELGHFEPHVLVCDLSAAEDQFNLLPHLPNRRAGAVALTRLGEGLPRSMPTGFDGILDRARDLDQLAGMVASVVSRYHLVGDSEKGERDQPVPPEQKQPPVQEPPGEPGGPPIDPRPEGDPKPNEPTRLV